MKFNLIDKIELLTDQRIVAVKVVSLAEEYLADHFPTFPVLPGVMMLEALTQAAAWFLHRRRNFACSMAVLKEARNVKYGNFVAPGDALRVELELVRETTDAAHFKATGTVQAAVGSPPGAAATASIAVAARIEMAYFNLADRQPALAEIDRRLREHNRRRWEIVELNSPAIAAISPAPRMNNAGISGAARSTSESGSTGDTQSTAVTAAQ